MSLHAANQCDHAARQCIDKQLWLFSVGKWLVGCGASVWAFSVYPEFKKHNFLIKSAVGPRSTFNGSAYPPRCPQRNAG
eukprot:4760547-Amphidinium_carterae.1